MQQLNNETQKKGIGQIFARLFASRREPAISVEGDAPSDGVELSEIEARLDECMDHADHDESAAFADVTDDTLRDMKQENAHSLDRDKNDFFFWNEARADAVAGMASVYLRARCPTPYWRSLVASSSYGLWGAVTQARAAAKFSGVPCGPEQLASVSFDPLSTQADQLARRPRPTAQEESDFYRADGLPLSGEFFGEVNKHAALRALFAAVLSGRPIAWPDLPPRLGTDADVPDRLPGLYINLETLEATPADVSREEAEVFWNEQPFSKKADILMVPDWACWMLSASHLRSFNKWPKIGKPLEF